MWTNENRGRYDRSKLRYPSDLTDEEWALIGPIIPSAKRGGNGEHLRPARAVRRYGGAPGKSVGNHVRQARDTRLPGISSGAARSVLTGVTATEHVDPVAGRHVPAASNTRRQRPPPARLL